ncbi:MAG: LysR family transcriptional regulator [Polyangiaceae bacterium]|nr:LysR family transcriptional regulator [Polyangiaceae bacterium]
MSISALDLNLLLVLDAVLSERSVARAARRLHVTPSAVSNSLARLRVALGDPLIARSGRGIVPTPRAAELAPALAHALRGLESVVHGATFDPATTTRTFTLAIADVGQVVRVPHLAARMVAAMPRARLRVVGIDSLISLGGLVGTEVDVALGAGEPGPGIHLEPLFDERTVLVARRDHPAIGKRLSRPTLEALRHVAIEMAPAGGVRDRAAAIYADAGVHREVAVIVPSFTAAAAVVAATDLVANIPASLVDMLGSSLGLRIVANPVAPYSVSMNLRWHERTHADAAMVAFRDLVRRSVAKD